MAKKVIQKRKTPKRRSSKIIYESILEAGAQLYNSHRYFKVSTNKIALLAGVSIGSLYQYFPNKEVIIDLLIDKMLEDNRSIFVDTLQTNSGSSLEEVIDQLVTMSFREFMKRKFFLKVFFKEIHNLNKMDRIIEHRKTLASEMGKILQSQYKNDLKDIEDLESTLYFLFNSYVGALQSYSYDCAESEEVFKASVSDLFKGFLVKV